MIDRLGRQGNRHIHVLRGRYRGKTANHSAFGQDGHVRLEGIETAEILRYAAPARTEHGLRYRNCIRWLGVTELHITDGKHGAMGDHRRVLSLIGMRCQQPLNSDSASVQVDGGGA